MDEDMPKTIKNQFTRALTMEKMLQAYDRAKLGKSNKLSVIKYGMDLETNLATLVTQIENGTYHIGRYQNFTIYEPKERLIRSLPFRDRVVHQWYVHEFIKPFLERKLITHTYACLDQRGTHKAMLQLQKYMRIMKRKYGTYYVVKCDVKKFFYSIDKQILYQIMMRHINDEKLRAFTKCLIFDGTGDVGIPIGNYTSQYFANIYLNELDHYIKEENRVRCYVRYMDDFILLVPTKEEARVLIKKAEGFLNRKLNLKLNPKSRYYPSYMGIQFCGYRIYETHLLLKKSSIIKIKRNIRKWNVEYQKGILDIFKVNACFHSWVAHAEHCNSFHLRTKIREMCEFQELLPQSEEI